MKNELARIIILPAFAALFIIGITFSYKVYTQMKSGKEEIPAEKILPTGFRQTGSGKPSAGLGLIKTPTIAPTPTVVNIKNAQTPGDFEQILATTDDDNGASDLNALDKEISGL